MSIRVYCAKKEEEKEEECIQQEEDFSQKRKVKLMNNTRGYICIRYTNDIDNKKGQKQR